MLIGLLCNKRTLKSVDNYHDIVLDKPDNEYYNLCDSWNWEIIALRDQSKIDVFSSINHLKYDGPRHKITADAWKPFSPHDMAWQHFILFMAFI